MPRRALLVCALAFLGCDDAIRVTLIPPIGEVARPVGYDCVDKLEVLLFGAVQEPSLCFDLAPGQIDTLRDHGLGSLLDAPVPNGFAALYVRGVRGNGAGCAGDSVFHGEGFYTGGDSLDVPLSRALDCRRFGSTPTPIQLLDLDALLTGGAGRCAPPATPERWRLVYIHAFPYLVNRLEYGVGYDTPSAPLDVSPTGLASVTGPHFEGAVEPSCMLIDADEISPTAEFTQVCYAPGAARLCATAGAELITMTADQAAPLFQLSDTIAVGLVFDAATKAPIAGATVTVITPDDGRRATYLGYTAGALSLTTATATSASGLFAIPTGVPTVVSVRRPGSSDAVRVVLPDGRISVGVQPIGLP